MTAPGAAGPGGARGAHLRADAAQRPRRPAPPHLVPVPRPRGAGAASARVDYYLMHITYNSVISNISSNITGNINITGDITSTITSNITNNPQGRPTRSLRHLVGQPPRRPPRARRGGRRGPSGGRGARRTPARLGSGSSGRVRVGTTRNSTARARGGGQCRPVTVVVRSPAPEFRGEGAGARRPFADSRRGPRGSDSCVTLCPARGRRSGPPQSHPCPVRSRAVMAVYCILFYEILPQFYGGRRGRRRSNRPRPAASWRGRASTWRASTSPERRGDRSRSRVCDNPVSVSELL